MKFPQDRAHPGDGLLTAVRRRSSHEGEGQPYREQAKTGQPATLARLAAVLILNARDASLKSRSARLLVKFAGSGRPVTCPSDGFRPQSQRNVLSSRGRFDPVLLPSSVMVLSRALTSDEAGLIIAFAER